MSSRFQVYKKIGSGPRKSWYWIKNPGIFLLAFMCWILYSSSFQALFCNQEDEKVVSCFVFKWELWYSYTHLLPKAGALSRTPSTSRLVVKLWGLATLNTAGGNGNHTATKLADNCDVISTLTIICCWKKVVYCFQEMLTCPNTAWYLQSYLPPCKHTGYIFNCYNCSFSTK